MFKKLQVTWLVAKSFAHILLRIYAGRTWHTMFVDLEEKDGRRLGIHFRRTAGGYCLQERHRWPPADQTSKEV